MNLEEIKAAVKANREKEILSVLNGEKDEASLLYTRLNDVIKFVESQGGSDDQNVDTNGWQWDYWAYVTHNNQKYMISGDGYYSDTCEFSKVNNEEE